MQPLVLLVDGDDDLRQTCAEYLQAHGFRVEEAADTMQALEKVQALAPSVLIIDASLARAEAVESLHLIDRGDAPPRAVIMLSADDSAEIRRRAQEMAGCTFMVKTSLPERLLSAVRAGLDATA